MHFVSKGATQTISTIQDMSLPATLANISEHVQDRYWIFWPMGSSTLGVWQCRPSEDHDPRSTWSSAHCEMNSINMLIYSYSINIIFYSFNTVHNEPINGLPELHLQQLRMKWMDLKWPQCNPRRSTCRRSWNHRKHWSSRSSPVHDWCRSESLVILVQTWRLPK